MSRDIKYIGLDIEPYKDDLFRKVIEQRKLNKSDKALYYWLKIFANSIYGFFVELIPELQSKSVPVGVYSGEKRFSDSSDVIEKPGPWFFPPLASLITSAGRLLLAMTEASVQERKGTYLFCDTDSLAIVSSKNSGYLNIQQDSRGHSKSHRVRPRIAEVPVGHSHDITVHHDNLN